MTIAYIKSNSKRRMLLVLMVAASPLLLAAGFCVDFWRGGYRLAAHNAREQVTQGGNGYWRSVREAWEPKRSEKLERIRAAKRMLGLQNDKITQPGRSAPLAGRGSDRA